MKPREKAIDLMNKYWELDVDDKSPLWSEKCKECVLIAINLLLEDRESVNVRYWLNVKRELENL